jgi:hypothetical protein
VSRAKRSVRAAFRAAVLARDGMRCRVCNARLVALDPHHITPRTALPFGGYVAENGIALCDAPGGCHAKAEAWQRDGTGEPGYDPASLYARIGSSASKARAACEAAVARAAREENSP